MKWHYFDNGKSVYFYYNQEKMPFFEIRRTRESLASDEEAIQSVIVSLAARPCIPSTTSVFAR